MCENCLGTSTRFIKVFEYAEADGKPPAIFSELRIRLVHGFEWSAEVLLHIDVLAKCWRLTSKGTRSELWQHKLRNWAFIFLAKADSYSIDWLLRRTFNRLLLCESGQSFCAETFILLKTHLLALRHFKRTGLFWHIFQMISKLDSEADFHQNQPGSSLFPLCCPPRGLSGLEWSQTLSLLLVWPSRSPMVPLQLPMLGTPLWQQRP